MREESERPLLVAANSVGMKSFQRTNNGLSLSDQPPAEGWESIEDFLATPDEFDAQAVKIMKGCGEGWIVQLGPDVGGPRSIVGAHKMGASIGRWIPIPVKYRR